MKHISTSKITSSLSTAQLILNPLPLIINYISILQFIYLYYNKDNSSSSNSNQPSIAFLISLLLSIITCVAFNLHQKNQIRAISSSNQSSNNVPFKFIEISSNRCSRSQSRDLRGSESSIDLLGHLSSWSTLERECQRLFTAILAEFEFPLSFFRRPARVSTANARQIRPSLFSTAAAALLNETISR